MPSSHRAPTDKPKNLRTSAKLLIASLKPWRLPIIIAILFAVASTVLSIFGPKILGNMTTDAASSLSATGAIDWGKISASAITLIILYAFSGLFGYFENFIIGRVSAKYTKSMRLKILDKINRLPVSYFDRHRFGDTLSRMSNDIDIVGQSLQNSLTEIITNLVMLVGILVMMLTISPLLSFIAIVAIPISTIAIAKIAIRAQKYFHRQQNTLGRISSVIEEDYSGQLIIKSNSHESASLANFTRVNDSLYDVSWKAQFFSSIAFPITHIFTNLSYIAICILGGYQAIIGRITIGNIQAFIQYTNQFNRPITSVAQIASTIQLTLAASERISTFLEEKEEPEALPNAAPLPKPAASLPIEFRSVNFAYSPDKPIIKNFSIKVTPGQTVALVGPTGAGKTTIVNLLMRFYDPTSGEILIGDQKTTDLPRETVRSLFGMVLQDTWLFSGTISENLRYGRPQATKAEVEKACRRAHVDRLIKSLEHGYKTKISEDSDNISAGEKQLLTIARAMLANPPMMILDEATSNVDTRTEQLIQNALEELTRGRTSFVIAHRLSTIRNADLILVMRDGKIIEQGTHTSLLQQQGFYADLYNSQFAEN